MWCSCDGQRPAVRPATESGSRQVRRVGRVVRDMYHGALSVKTSWFLSYTGIKSIEDTNFCVSPVIGPSAGTFMCCMHLTCTLRLRRGFEAYERKVNSQAALGHSAAYSLLTGIP